MRFSVVSRTAVAAALFVATFATAEAQSHYPPPNPPNCRNTGSFDSWLDGFRKEAAANGISRATLASALGAMTLGPERHWA